MFERYTEDARRAIFFARYEASILGSPYIECAHLVLAMLRDGMPLRRQLDETQRAALRDEIVRQFQTGVSVSTSVDLPLSATAKAALSFGAQEAHRLHDPKIRASHTLLGVLQADAKIAELLEQYGVKADRQRALLEVRADDEWDSSVWFGAAEQEEMLVAILAPSLRASLDRLQSLAVHTMEHLDRSPAAGDVLLKRRPWSRRQAMGHLIDWAAGHQQLFARALTEPSVTVPLLAQDSWVEPQGYSDVLWPRLVRLWVGMNELIAHVLARIPEEKLVVPCRIGIASPQPLAQIIDAYVDHCDDILGQVLLHTGK